MLGLELLVIKEINSHGISVCLKPCMPEVITPTLASEIRHLQNSLVEQYISSPWEGYFYVIWYSHRGHGTCGRGLDFNYILESIYSNREIKFEAYIKDLFDLLFLNYVGLGLPLINCSIVDRVISGISQEFFFLNKINFIKSYSADILGTKISPVNFFDVANNLVFPKTIYQNNLFYKFCYFDLKSMRNLIANTSANAIDEDNLEHIRHIFDDMRDQTITEIYKLASTNLKLLERVAKMQTRNASLAM